MLIKFSVTNFLSFAQETVFSTIASREKQHIDRLIQVSELDLKLTPISAVYGANASGKSNFVEALVFARRLIVEGTKAEEQIDVSPFRLKPSYADKPSSFYFELLIEGTAYGYGFEVSRDRVHREWLTEIQATEPKIIFNRDLSKDKVFDLKGLKRKIRTKEWQRLEYEAEGTRPNQLFICEASQRNVPHFLHIFHWFKNSLIIIHPHSKPRTIEFSLSERTGFKRYSDLVLRRLDTGIATLESEKVSLDSADLPLQRKEELRKDLKDGEWTFVKSTRGDRLSVRCRKGEIEVARLIARHNSEGSGSAVKFEMKDESDGTLRIIDLLPAFYNLCETNTASVYVIDELDRSLHTHVTRSLVQSFLQSRTREARAQLIFTTHDPLLMDQNILRRDEVWLIEKSDDGHTELLSLCEFKDIRKDKDIRKSYLTGRFGGVPRIKPLVGSTVTKCS